MLLQSLVRDCIGYAAGTLATLAFVPQVLKTVRHQQTRDISLGMYLLFCSGVLLWLVYGFLVSSRPIVISNLITFLLACTVLALKLKNG